MSSKCGPWSLPRAGLEGGGSSRAWGEEIPDLTSFLQEQLGQGSEPRPNGQQLPPGASLNCCTVCMEGR